MRELVRCVNLPRIGLVKLLAANGGNPLAVERRLTDAATTEGVFGLARAMAGDGAQLRLHEGTDAFRPGAMSSFDGLIVQHVLACGQFRRLQFDAPDAKVLTAAIWRCWDAVSPLPSPQVTRNRSGGYCAKDAKPTKQNTNLEGRCTPTKNYSPDVKATLAAVDRAVVAAVATSWPHRRGIAIMQSGDVAPSNADQQQRAVDISSQHNLPAGSVWSTRVNHLSLCLGEDTGPAESVARGLVNLSEATRLPGEEGLLSPEEKEVAMGILMLRFGLHFAENEARGPEEKDVVWSVSHEERVEKMRGGIDLGLEKACEIMAEVGPGLLRKKTLGKEERSRGGKEGGPKSNFGLTAGDTVAGAMAREAAAKAAVDAADDETAAAAKKNLDDATKKRKLTKAARADQATGAKASIGTKYQSQGQPRGPGGAGEKDFDYSPFREDIGEHHRGYKDDKGKPVASKGRSNFFLYKNIKTVNAGELTLGTHAFDSRGENLVQSYPCTKDGIEIARTATIKNRAYNQGLMSKARAQAPAALE